MRGNEIGFVYYRSGYQAEQYTSEEDWEARKVLELSQAIKCPSIDYHLTTFKKFQQSFCDPEVLKQVLTERQRFEDVPEQLKPVFTGMWSLENFDEQPSVQEIVKKAIEDPRNFVVKPQKEGGGNNFYDEEAKALL